MTNYDLRTNKPTSHSRTAPQQRWCSFDTKTWTSESFFLWPWSLAKTWKSLHLLKTWNPPISLWWTQRSAASWGWLCPPFSLESCLFFLYQSWGTTMTPPQKTGCFVCIQSITKPNSGGEPWFHYYPVSLVEFLWGPAFLISSLVWIRSSNRYFLLLLYFVDMTGCNHINLTTVVTNFGSIASRFWKMWKQNMGQQQICRWFPSLLSQASCSSLSLNKLSFTSRLGRVTDPGSLIYDHWSRISEER